MDCFCFPLRLAGMDVVLFKGTERVNMEIDRQALLEVMDQSDAVYIGTVAGAAPRIRAMVNLRRADQYPRQSEYCRTQGFTVFLTTSDASSKVRELRANPSVCVYFVNPRDYRGVMLTGRAEILTDQELKSVLWEDSWRIYWPVGVQDPDYVVVRVAPEAASGWWGSTPFHLELGSL
jgi:general stress protein 26